MQYQTYLVAEVPRTKCGEHGVHQIQVPWAEEHSRFTALFEILAIDWLREASVKAVAGMLGLSWDEVAGIQERAVRRGLSRRRPEPVEVLGIDETSFQKRHEYVTAICDVRRGRVLHVMDGRGKDEVEKWLEALPEKLRRRVKIVAMDMWEAYIAAVENKLPDAEIAFDRFHVAMHLNDAVDKVRREEHRKFRASGNDLLKGTKYLWIQNEENMTPENVEALSSLKNKSLRVARAWAIKEMARHLWYYRSRGWAEKVWKRWLGWVQRCRLQPMMRVGRMIRNHFDGVMTAVISGVTNAASEATNSRIQWVKRLACGFRNRERFKMAIYFHLGGLDLYPRPVS
jgi:transposase